LFGINKLKCNTTISEACRLLYFADRWVVHSR